MISLVHFIRSSINLLFLGSVVGFVKCYGVFFILQFVCKFHLLIRFFVLLTESVLEIVAGLMIYSSQYILVLLENTKAPIVKSKAAVGT